MKFANQAFAFSFLLFSEDYDRVSLEKDLTLARLIQVSPLFCASGLDWLQWNGFSARGCLKIVLRFLFLGRETPSLWRVIGGVTVEPV